MKSNFKVNQIVRCKRDYWRDQRQIVRIGTRRRLGYGYRYFVTALNHPPGYGVWADESELTQLTPLELLAISALD